MTAAHAASSYSGSRPGLRERKKIRTRDSIREAAYRLFLDQGYDATPVDQIADAAEVSPSTVFRYFPTKEDIVLSDEYDALIEDALRRRPAGEPPVTALREALWDVLAQWYEHDIAETRQRMRLIQHVSTIRARMAEHTADTARVLANVLSERTGRPVDDLELRVVTGAMLGALSEAVHHWAEEDMRDDLSDLVADALDVLERGLTL